MECSFLQPIDVWNLEEETFHPLDIRASQFKIYQSRNASKYWQVARVAGKVPNLEKVQGRSMVRREVLLSIYISYDLVSIPTPWAVAGPHGQLVSR